MSPSTYLIAIPLGFIAVSSWLVKMQHDSFARTDRTRVIQQLPRHTSAAIKGNTAEIPPILRLDHDRYGWHDDGDETVNLLGTSPSRRALGARTSRLPDWLDTQAAALSVTQAVQTELPDIPGLLEIQSPSDSPFQTVPAGSGFHITADEVTKVDMNSDRVVFNGNVKMTSPHFHLAAAQLVVHLGKDKKSFKLAEARESVSVQLTGVPDEKKYRGQSQAATYDPGKGTIILSGWPKIQGQGQELIAAEQGTRVTLFPKTGRMLTEGRAQTRVAKQLMAEQAANP